jgi:hypothetical protein
MSLEKQVTMFAKKQIEYFNVRGSILYGAIYNNTTKSDVGLI